MFWIYNLLVALSVPLFPIVKLKTKERGEVHLRPRLSTDFPGAENKLFLHAASIGEVNTVKPLIEKLKGKVALTTFTDYGLERAKKLYPEVPSRVVPLDFYPLIKKFLKRSRPKAFLIYESEIWPSLLRATGELSIPLFFVSGKIGERAYRRLLKFKRFLKPLIEDKTFLAKSQKDAERALEVGFKKVEVVGDLKLDYEPPKERAPLKIEGRRSVITWGSTHAGEERLAAEVHRKLKEEFPGLLTVIAPRHVKRAKNLKLPGKTVFRSESQTVPTDTEFYVVNTVGELPSLYSYSTVAVVGGSFVPGIGGHNPVEPVAAGVPTVMGIYGTEFSDVAERLGIEVVPPEKVTETLRNLLKNPKLRREKGERSYLNWKMERGVSERILKKVGETVEL